MSMGAITLHGGIQDDEDKVTSAILFKLDHGLLQEVQDASAGSLQFIGGRVPKIRLGKRSIDLTISDEAFRHELYSASLDSIHDLRFTGLISHRAELKTQERKQSVGSDAALAALQSTLASYKRDKQANSTNITSSVLPAPRSRFDAARKQKQDARRGLLSQVDLAAANDSRHTPSDPLPPMPNDDFVAKQQAMRTPLIHLLAMRPMSRESIIAKTRIPKDSLDDLLQRFAKQVDGKWQLTEKAFKQLDVHKFPYPTSEDREAAIQNAIRAFDKSRLGRDEKEWQMLLPENERGKGKVLSKLQLPGTANSLLSPNPNLEPAGETKLVSAANTPRLGPSTTPKIGPGKTDAALSKRLFAKNPQKARATEDAKERKRKERETAASDKESSKPPPRKKQMIKPTNSKFKSAEIVHSSEDESGEEGEVKESKPNTQQKSATVERKTINNSTAKPYSKPIAATKSPESSDGPIMKAKPAPANNTSLPAKPSPSSSLIRTSKPAATKKIPNGTSATSSHPKAQLSPQKPTSRPKVPSPLGPSRPRVTSDVSERGAVGMQRAKQGAETPKLSSVTSNGVRKRQDTVTSSTESIASSGSDKTKREVKVPVEKAAKPAVNVTVQKKTAPVTNGNVKRPESGSLKRKPSETNDTISVAKHRRVESESSKPLRDRTSSPAVAAAVTAVKPTKSATIKVDDIFSFTNGSGNNLNDKSTTILSNIKYSQGVTLAQRFRQFYPKYTEIYDAQAAREERGDKVPREEREMLWEMHKRLSEMKMQMKAASNREHLEETV